MWGVVRRAVVPLACTLMLGTSCVPGLAQGETAPSTAEGPPWTLLLPQDDRLVFRGVVNLDGAGMGAGSMMYPAPNAAGFLAALITHGILLESTKSSQKQKLQDEADKVLLPYAAVLQDFGLTELLQRSLEKSSAGRTALLLPEASPPAGDWVVASVPVYSMTQDERALILEAAISLHRKDATTPTYQGVIRVVSSPRDDVELPSYWNAEQGKALKDEAAELLAHALDIAMRLAPRAQTSDPSRQRTFRYRAGTADRYERAELLFEECDRVVIRNLRGAFMSIPFRGDADAQCDAGRLLSSEPLLQF